MLLIDLIVDGAPSLTQAASHIHSTALDISYMPGVLLEAEFLDISVTT